MSDLPSSTRTDSLLHLMQEASEGQIRQNAAEALGQVVLQYPSAGNYILEQVRPLTTHSEWETREAAATCLKVISKSIFHPDACNATLLFATTSLGEQVEAGLGLKNVPFDSVIHSGAPLLRSGGEEYEYEASRTEEERKKYAFRQRRLLLKRICGSQADIWKSRENALAQSMLPQLNREHMKELAKDIEQGEEKAEIEQKSRTKADQVDASKLIETSLKRSAEDDLSFDARKRKRKEDDRSDLVGDDDCSEMRKSLAALLADLFECIFDSKWEVRHGALLSIREIFLSSDTTHKREESQAYSIVDAWIEECLVRCICVLGLDQFVDYSADGAVAPVRQVCAQVLGILLGTFQSEKLMLDYLRVLRKVVQGPTWHARHGGLLGLRYLILAHTYMADSIVPTVMSDVLSSLNSSADEAEEEVVVVAVWMLLDFTPFMKNVDQDVVEEASNLLWMRLQEHQSGVIAAAVVEALNAWYHHGLWLVDGSTSIMWTTMVVAIPLVHHEMKSVRKAMLECLGAIFGSNVETSKDLTAFTEIAIPHMLLQLVQEEDKLIRKELQDAYERIVVNARVKEMDVLAWVELLWTKEAACAVAIPSVASDTDNRIVEKAEVDTRGLYDDTPTYVQLADALGLLLSTIPMEESNVDNILSLLSSHLSSSNGKKLSSALLLTGFWAQRCQLLGQFARLSELKNAVGDTIESLARKKWQPPGTVILYEEIKGALHRERIMEERIIEVFTKTGVQVDSCSTQSDRLASTVSRKVAEHVASFPFDSLAHDPRAFDTAHFKRQDLFLLDESIQSRYSKMEMRIKSTGTFAYVHLLPLPTKKSGFLVSALMDAVKGEEEEALQSLSASVLAEFIHSEAKTQPKCVTKLLSNLCNNATAKVKHEASADKTVLSKDLQHTLNVRVRGADLAISCLCERTVKEVIVIGSVIETFVDKAWSSTDVDICQSMRIIELLATALGDSIGEKLLKWMENMAVVLDTPSILMTTMESVASALASICAAVSKWQEKCMLVLIRDVLPTSGGVFALERLVSAQGSTLLPYLPVLVHVAMQLMGAQEEGIRKRASKTFSALVPLIPLRKDLSASQSTLASKELQTLVSETQTSRQFLENLLEGNAIEAVDTTSVLKSGVQLRKYQQHGIDWIHFLTSNGLHGILADDMGLGKTLQALAAMSLCCRKVQERGENAVCLVICPPSVVYHWIQEVSDRIADDIFDEVVDYSGPASTRKRLRSSIKSGAGTCLVVTTYAILRSDLDFMSSFQYEFLALDESHVIRNPNTALFRAVTSLRSKHRLALSGTPLQNQAGDLWAAFEFLMPGYLGDNASFRKRFATPIAKSKEHAASGKQKEAAALAINELHQSVLPFILRRTKTQVLQDLPPKIISDVLLPPSGIQQRLMEVVSEKEWTETPLVRVQTLKRVCVHPALVQHQKALVSCVSASNRKDLTSWKSSCKMVGLRDVLVDSCGLGDKDEQDVGSLHRCVIFAQLRETLDLTEKLLQEALPKVTFTRMDGETQSSKRGEIVDRFNRDPSIDLLLLTTQVGGLGLTLTGADTVIFLEHSWNPFVDLQAMDRTHRLGQKRTVRVFRLITKDSIEQDVVNLQAFKERVANTTIKETEAKASANANTTQVLQMLQQSSDGARSNDDKKEVKANAMSYLPKEAQKLLEQAGELWDESQYDSLAFPSTSSSV